MKGHDIGLKISQVLEDTKAVDDAFTAGKDIKPLCGLAFAVKDNIDVLGYVHCTTLQQTSMQVNFVFLEIRLL